MNTLLNELITKEVGDHDSGSFLPSRGPSRPFGRSSIDNKAQSVITGRAPTSRLVS